MRDAADSQSARGMRASGHREGGGGRAGGGTYSSSGQPVVGGGQQPFCVGREAGADRRGRLCGGRAGGQAGLSSPRFGAVSDRRDSWAGAGRGQEGVSCQSWLG